jgi:molybdopterin molybdotransferase
MSPPDRPNAGREFSAEEALAELRGSFARIVEHEIVPVGEALGRILTTGIHSQVDSPAFDNSAMDGYAVRAEDCLQRAHLTVIGTALAGHSFDRALSQGQAVRIMTGAPLPQGADAVVMSEDAEETESGIRLARSIPAGTNVRRKGEHVKRGECVLRKGRRLRPQDLGLAASAGAVSLEVMRRLKVGVLSTGDELVDAPARLPASGAYDGNRPLLCALAAAVGYDVLDLGISADDPAAFARALSLATASGIDVLITTGGAAQGDADVVRHHGDVRFIALDFRPGRGIAVGALRNGAYSVSLLGLPGNAVAAYTVYQLVARPLLAWIAGAEVELPLTLSLPLASDARVKPGRVEWRRARLVRQDQTVVVELLKDQGSAMLRTVSEADALVAIGPEAARAGDAVATIPLAALD